MSAQQKVQQHPAFQQAQAKAHYYLAQLDKEVRLLSLSRSFCGAEWKSDDAA
jgi:receptor expression-enhancing protein 5/6